jgi:hypothetical protein
LEALGTLIPIFGARESKFLSTGTPIFGKKDGFPVKNNAPDRPTNRRSIVGIQDKRIGHG